MKRPLALWAVFALGTTLVPLSTVAAHPNVDPAPTAAPGAALSTSGDYATDTFGDPWDFSNDDDVPPVYQLIGSENSAGIVRNANAGTLTVSSRNNSTIKLVRTWGLELPWGRDGLLHPVAAATYSKISFSMCIAQPLHMAVDYWNTANEMGLHPFYPTAGCHIYDIDLRDISSNPPGYQTPWTGSMIRVELLRGGTPSGTDPLVDPLVDITLDWVRLRRSDAPRDPPAGLPLPQVLSPNEQGGTDVATAAGNPWDFASLADIYEIGKDVRVDGLGPGGIYGVTQGNDPYIEMRLPAPLDPDRYHRATIDVCNYGAMSFANAPGGGMNGRLAWLPVGGPAWSETQDIIIYPGCNTMTIDLATTPAGAVNDENTVFKRGWRGQRIARLRYDLNEDPGVRSFTLRSVKLADDASFASTFPITFTDAAGLSGSTADIYVTTNRGQFDGTRIAAGLTVTSGTNTFVWAGNTDTGQPMPNGTYWVYVVLHRGAGVATAYSTGPVRMEKPVPPTPSYFVPLTPARLLDTRSGIGGNLVPLGQQISTSLPVAGVGGVPATHVTAVVMNVTAVTPTQAGFLTVWPSGEGQPVVSNINFVAGQVVPNLVTVKVGADGRVNIYNSSGDTDVVADVVGYYTDLAPPGGGLFTPLPPARVLDTRDGTGGFSGAVPAGGKLDLTVTGVGGVPGVGASAVALNVTVDQPTAEGFITTWPTGESMPTASTHNFVPGLTVANLVLAKVGAGGKVSLFNSAGSTHLVADVVGYFSASGGRFVPVTPKRLVDTRDGTGAARGPIGQGQQFTPRLADGSPVPAWANGIVANITSADATAQSYVTAWPADLGRPGASTLNPRPNVPVPNQAYLKLGGGSLGVFNATGSTAVIIDVFGYIE